MTMQTNVNKMRQAKANRKTYEPPMAEVISLEVHGVLCASRGGGRGITTNNVTTETFIFP